ncbi:MAG: hypothetical protein ACI37Q_06370 [Candidatus Gastranaerophilaceae bacterium]
MISPIYSSFPNLKTQSISFSSNKTNITDNKQAVKETAEKKGISKPLAIGATLGGIATVGAAVYFLSRGQGGAIFKLTDAEQAKLNELIESGKLDKKYADFFREMYETGAISDSAKLKTKLAEFLGYKISPDVEIDKNLDKSGMALYIVPTGKIRIGEKVDLGILYHELVHFSQFDKLYRAFGKDAIIEGMVKGAVNGFELDKLKGSKRAMATFGKEFDKLTPEELNKFTSDLRKSLSESFNEDFYKKVAESKGQLTPEELEDAQKYLKALEAADRDHAALENEAYTREIQFEKKFNEFISIFK